MNATVEFSAVSKYGYSGQYIAKITGRDPEFTFSRKFVGKKFGKRRETTGYVTDEPGLYMECDVDKHGKTESFYIAYDLPGYGLRLLTINREDAMAYAKRMDSGALDWQREALSKRLAALEELDPEGMNSLPVDQLGFKAGSVRRGDLIDSIRRYLGIGAEEPESSLDDSPDDAMRLAEFTTEQLEAEIARRAAAEVTV